jgi:hypothetical protein
LPSLTVLHFFNFSFYRFISLPSKKTQGGQIQS